MKTDLDNRQDSPDLNRSGTPHVKSIGPHEHGWEFYGTGNDGGAYQVCQLCGARRVVDRPLVSSPHRDWIDGRAEWVPDDNPDAVAKRERAEARVAAKDEPDHDDKPHAGARAKATGKKAD